MIHDLDEPAHPAPHLGESQFGDPSTYTGVTARDYFAAAAMQGDIAAMVDPDGEYCGLKIDATDDELDKLANLYFRMADAMLRRRCDE